MTTTLSTIGPDTPLSEIQNLMVTYDIGRLPVLHQGTLLGIVTRTDVLRQVYQNSLRQSPQPSPPRADQLPQPPTQIYQRLRQGLAPEPQLWRVLMLMAEAAHQRGWHLYVVGGAVRDLLLTPTQEPVSLQDIDLVVDGFQSTVEVGAGVALAQVIQQQYPDVDLQIHGQFQTAALIWHRMPHPLVIDVATARTEFYPYPAANPEVEASSIRQDLYRRDFTINAMAVRLTKPQPGLLLDYFGGWFDLQARQIRVLHANSFIEDPTRIFRAVRFAVRLGFTLNAQTETFIRYAVESGVYNELQAQPKRVPALQTRLKAELQSILEAPYWIPALTLIDRLGALSCLHPDLRLTPELWRQMNRIERWIHRFELNEQVETWLLLLEVMLAQLATAVRSQVAINLHLPESSLQRLSALALTETRLLKTLSPPPHRPSQIYQALHPLDLSTLLLVSARHPRTLGPQIWQYLTRLATLKPLLNGNDLKRLGYSPGPKFREMLTALTYATLDGDLHTRSDAVDYLAEHFPLKAP
jgi:tRNA nucleotidyltransferase (CCA-adding enzyme)